MNLDPVQKTPNSNRRSKSTTKLRTEVIFGKYKLIKKIGMGAFGSVYAGEDVRSHEKVALKFEKLSSPKLFLENETYSLVNNKGFGIPSVKSFGIYHKNKVLVQEFLGNNLESLFEKSKKRFSIKDICMIMIQVIERVEHVHK